MTLFTDQQYQQLIENGKPGNCDKDHLPVARLHILYSRCQWLLSELDSERPNIAFGLCDLGMGFPELGYVDLEELEAAAKDVFLMNDVFFTGKYPMSVYADAAREVSGITDDIISLDKYAAIAQKKQGPKL